MNTMKKKLSNNKLDNEVVKIISYQDELIKIIIETERCTRPNKTIIQVLKNNKPTKPKKNQINKESTYSIFYQKIKLPLSQTIPNS